MSYTVFVIILGIFSADDDSSFSVTLSDSIISIVSFSGTPPVMVVEAIFKDRSSVGSDVLRGKLDSLSDNGLGAKIIGIPGA